MVATREYNRTLRANAPDRKPHQPPKYGTRGGYRRHLRIGEEPCEPCSQASRDYANSRNRKKGIPALAPRARRLAPCGTTSAYRRHLRDGETPCDACLAASRNYATGLRRRQGVPAFQPAQCGTRAGYSKHYRIGEKPCELCKQSFNEGSKLRKFRKQLWHDQNGICQLCFRPVPLDPGSVEVDHKVPKSKGGDNGISNLQVVHPRCNRIKWNRSDEEARERIAAMLAADEY